MSLEKAFVIAKQDGPAERFSDAKLRNCLATVLAAARQDPKLANPLARAVAMHLCDWSEREPPSSEYVYRCVQAVLQQTDLRPAARCMAVHRRRRRARRRQVRVVYPERASAPAVGWRKARVVASLRNTHGLRTPVARLLAGEVEARVLDLGFDHVQAPLVAALVQNVLMTWGFSAGDCPATAGGVPVAAARPEARTAAKDEPPDV